MDYPNLPTVAARLKWARDRLHLTQQQLADKAGIGRDSIAKLETGETRMSRYFKEIADAAEVSQAWLMFGNEAIDNLPPEHIELLVALSTIPDDAPEKDAIKSLILAARDRYKK